LGPPGTEGTAGDRMAADVPQSCSIICLFQLSFFGLGDIGDMQNAIFFGTRRSLTLHRESDQRDRGWSPFKTLARKGLRQSVTAE
jgi:hypothetical protein